MSDRSPARTSAQLRPEHPPHPPKFSEAEGITTTRSETRGSRIWALSPLALPAYVQAPGSDPGDLGASPWPPLPPRSAEQRRQGAEPGLGATGELAPRRQLKLCVQ